MTPMQPDDPQAVVWPLSRVLAEVAVGSRDWTWEEEWADLDQRHAATGYLDTLEQQIRENGITMPVLIGSDGRLWDGHHRLRIASRLGIEYVPVEIVEPAPERVSDPLPATEMLAFVAEMCDIADQQDTLVTTVLVREWLQGPKSGQRVSFPPEDSEDSRKLRALEAAGVDNWDGYDRAMEILHESDGE